MEWIDVKESIRADLLGRNLKEPQIRLKALDRIETLLACGYPGFLRDPRILWRAGKNAVFDNLSRLKAPVAINGAEKSVLTEIFRRLAVDFSVHSPTPPAHALPLGYGRGTRADPSHSARNSSDEAVTEGVATLYWKPHPRRAREAEFGAKLIGVLKLRHVAADFDLPREILQRPVSSTNLQKYFHADRFLPCGRSERCIQALRTLPEEIIVALSPARVTFDFVVVRGSDQYYWEFHEQQHRNLSVDRPQAVYDASGNQYRVPRFLQRLIRDIWRLENFQNFTIVWHDWFATNRTTYVPSLRAGCWEYHRRGAFSFKTFLGAGRCTTGL